MAVSTDSANGCAKRTIAARNRAQELNVMKEKNPAHGVPINCCELIKKFRLSDMGRPQGLELVIQSSVGMLVYATNSAGRRWYEFRNQRDTLKKWRFTSDAGHEVILQKIGVYRIRHKARRMIVLEAV